MSNKDGLDLNRANVDTCYKIFNKKADGSCGKMLKFVINFYHTTSQILVNGNKTDIFITDILEKLGTEMRARCDQLDIINTNITTALTKTGTQDKLSQRDQIQYTCNNENESETNIELSVDETESDSEVCEICPICQEPAYGKVVQCGECGDWHHFECINISDAAIDTLGSDDFICINCTDNLKYSTSENDNEKSIHDPEVENLHASCNESSVGNKYEDPQGACDQQNQESYSVPPNMTVTSENKTSNELPIENNPKTKPKRTAKVTSKVKKDDVIDKSYILDLENQINVLKSTLNLYEKSKGINQKQPEHSPLTKPTENQRQEHSCIGDQICSHRCCTELKDKLQENRMRTLEMQMMQNLYINNALQLQLAYQTRPHYQNVVYPYPTFPTTGTIGSYVGPVNNGFPNHMLPPNHFNPHGYHHPYTPTYQPPQAMNYQARPPIYVPAPVIQPPQYRTMTPSVPVIPTAPSNIQQPPQPQTTHYNRQHERVKLDTQLNQTRDTNHVSERNSVMNKSQTCKDILNSDRFTPNENEQQHIPKRNPTNGNQQTNVNRLAGTRKRHSFDKIIPSDKTHSIEKKLCERPESASKKDQSDSIINSQNSHPTVSESDHEVRDNLNFEIQQDNYIHITDTPKKPEHITGSDENESNHFLSLPPRKHNPPELMQQIQAEDSREQAWSPAI